MILLCGVAEVFTQNGYMQMRSSLSHLMTLFTTLFSAAFCPSCLGNTTLYLVRAALLIQLVRLFVIVGVEVMGTCLCATQADVALNSFIRSV